MPKLLLKPRNKPAIIITREAIRDEKLVYFIRANKRIKYPWAHSSIVYIGMTSAGAHRMASSAAHKAYDILKLGRFRKLEIFVVTSWKLPGKASWPMLERAFVVKFKEIYGAVPERNKAFKNAKWRNERNYFNVSKLERILKSYEPAI